MKEKLTYRIRILILFVCFSLIYTLSICGFIWLSKKSPLMHVTISVPQSTEYPIVIIDAGHGGEDGGAVGINGCLEKDLNLIIAKKLDTQLKSNGINTVMTRTEDILLYDKNSDYEGQKKKLDLHARLEISRQYENAIFVSIHMNSFSMEKYSGLQVYYSTNDDKSRVVAESIQSLAKQELSSTNNRTVKPTNGKIFLLDNAYVPSVLIECGFISNRTECALLCQEDYQNKLAMTICSALTNTIKEISDNG